MERGLFPGQGYPIPAVSMKYDRDSKRAISVTHGGGVNRVPEGLRCGRIDDTAIADLWEAVG